MPFSGESYSMKYKLHSLILSFVIFIPLCVFCIPPGAPYNLRCQQKTNPVGTDDKPSFGWYVKDDDNNEVQSAYQLLVSSSLDKLNNNQGDLWDSRKTISDRQNYIYYSGKTLLPATRYYWKVRTWDKDGNAGKYSAAAWFDTGLFDSADWDQSKWIKRDSGEKDDYTYFRKNALLLNKPIKRAIVYISASHEYELFVNGKFVSKGAVHHYPQYQYYHAYDITGVLQAGKQNVFAGLSHWYGGGQGRAPGSRGFIIKAIIEYADGKKSIIGTDGTWKVLKAGSWISAQPPRNGEGIGYIDKIDSRNFLPGWNSLNFDDKTWQAAAVIGAAPVAPWINKLQPDLTRLIEKEIQPESIVKTADNKYIIDLGKIYAGVPVITFKGGTAGETVKITGGFALNQDGTVSTTLNQSTNMSYSFILNGKEAQFKPMVYLGMRYLQVENSPAVLNKTNVRFIMRHYDLDPSRSSFSSSDVMLNQVWELMKYSLIVGAQENFVDTPTREKGAFLGDSWSQGVPAMVTMGDRAMNVRALTEFLNSQDQYWPDGRLNAVYPNVDGKRDIPDYTQSYLVWIWDYYLQTGDSGFLKNNYVRLKKVADYVDAYIDKNTGLVNKLAGGRGPYEFGIIDWPSEMRYGYDMKPEARTVINAYAYIDFDLISRIAGVTGNRADSITYATKAEAIKTEINKRLISSDGIYIDGLYNDLSASTHASQHANMFPLAMGIVPEANRSKVIGLVKDQKMSVGMVTLRWLPEAIGQAGEGEHLLALYTNAEWDGWAKNIKQGATVTWESWDADKRNESMSHPWGAAGLLGITEYILGVKPLSPQYGLIQVKPLAFNKSLDNVKGILPTDRGDISVEWKRSDTGFQMNLIVPTNMKANVLLPKNSISGNVITLNGKKVPGKEEDGYYRLDTIGSGKYSIVLSEK